MNIMTSSTDLPPCIPVKEISKRLTLIFPNGTPNRNYVTRELAAKTIFVMLYAGACENRDTFIRPDQVVRMSDNQGRKKKDEERLKWAEESLKPSDGSVTGQWYAANTRESIRDETLRQGFIPLNAVIERTGLPTTSSKPRYALRTEFAELFASHISKEQLSEKIADATTPDKMKSETRVTATQNASAYQYLVSSPPLPLSTTKSKSSQLVVIRPILN